ncbi:allantoinase AllB [Cryobacterium frigoriphilum]|uniref:allantoinase n=1 Tax=Cryobacterium frigoriphilum TaxID=1259150 RepID=A0A4R9A7T1_9MICO|nr:allantoinase AllB [Cryobacterium frigoriphilum]TFD53919.1 allantoinase AllB [Cryobacterium frigoriphilum]
MSATFDLVIRSQRVLVGAEFVPAAVAVRGGRIVAIEPLDTALAARHEVLLPHDQMLVPGLVDTHVHVNEPGRTDWEGFASATLAAAAGGVTTIIDMPLNSLPPTCTVSALEQKRRVAGPKASVDVGFWGGAIPGNLGSLRELHDAGVFGFKAFLSPSGVPEFEHLSLDQLEAAATEIAAFDGLLLVHAEDPEVLAGAVNGGGDAYRDFVASRPDRSETDAVGHVIEAVRRTGVRAHILHLSSAAPLPALAAARAEGLPITVETCPHYLFFSAEQISDGATAFKCCPPIRDSANRDLLWQGLESGVIDCIASDHSPSTRALKLGHGGDFGLAWGGISGLQLSLAAVCTAAASRGIGLERVLGWMSGATAALARLPGKGRIALGADADLVAFAPAESFTVDASQLRHKNPISAFDGTTLTGRVQRTWLGGASVYAVDDGIAGVPLGVLRRP